MAHNVGTPPSTATSLGPSLIRLIPNSSWAATTQVITPALFSPPAPRTGMNSGASPCQRKTQPFLILRLGYSVSTNSSLRAHDSRPTARLHTSRPGPRQARTTPNGTTQNQTANTGTGGSANFSTKSGRGTYTLTVNNITKTGYTFDRTGSVLTKSITK